MVDRTRERAAVYRRHTSWRVYDAIVRTTCLHVDGWLYQTSDDQLYFVFITTRGGTKPLAHTMYRVDEGTLTPVTYDASIHRDGLARHIDSPWARRNAPWLNALYWRDIAPTLRQPVEGFKGHRSIMLRFVYTDPTLDDPFAGLENLYSITGRRARDDAQRLHVTDLTPRARSPWGAKERSVLRTLDKLLR